MPFKGTFKLRAVCKLFIFLGRNCFGGLIIFLAWVFNPLVFEREKGLEQIFSFYYCLVYKFFLNFNTVPCSSGYKTSGLVD